MLVTVPEKVAFRVPVRTLPPSRGEVLWSGHVFNMAGYAKANREILTRISKHMRVRLSREGIQNEPRMISAESQKFFDRLTKNRVSDNAPMVRFYTPCFERSNRHKVIFTMMETEQVHKGFMDRMNDYYNEVWTPTRWNLEAFSRSGCELPVSLVPLGIEPELFKPGPRRPFPECTKLVPKGDLPREVPEGFHFFTVFHPTFRKGLHILLPAFEEAFRDDPEATLILGTTVHPLTAHQYIMDLVRKHIKRSRVYLLYGRFSEEQMADNYRSAHAYVTISLGEGWNLPMCEAAACGKPVIASANSAHLDIVDDSCAYLVEPDGYAPYPRAKKVCMWYDDMPFAIFEHPARERIVKQLRYVKENYPEALGKGLKLSKRVREKYTWDNTARIVMNRLTEIAE